MNTTLPPLVSVVTPTYNEEEHLAECIESVLAQTYQNWELVVVNNCSTDASAEIARQYAARDHRIRVHENSQFLRAVANQNMGLRQICPASKYCKIVFADDWIFPECLEEMVALAEEHPTVGIVGAYGLRGSEVMWTGLPYPSGLVSGREICRRFFLEDLYVFGTPGSVLFRSELVRKRDPFYNESNLHADSETCCALLKGCDFGFVHKVLTFTRLRPGSLTEFTAEINTLLAHRLHDLVTHGRDYLTAEEFETCLDDKLSEYYKFLAGNVLRHRDCRFWGFHKKKLADTGVGFDRARLARAFLAKLVGAALNPKDSIGKLLKVRSGRRQPAMLSSLQENRGMR